MGEAQMAQSGVVTPAPSAVGFTACALAATVAWVQSCEGRLECDGVLEGELYGELRWSPEVLES